MCKLLIKINIVEIQLWENPFVSFFLVFKIKTFSLDWLKKCVVVKLIILICLIDSSFSERNVNKSWVSK